MKFGLISFTALALAALPVLAMAQTDTTAQGQALSGSQSALNYAPTYNENTSSRVNQNVDAPDMVIEGANVCAMPDSFSLAGGGFAGGVALSKPDKQCEQRANDETHVAILWNIGERAAAVAAACQDPDMAKAMKSVNAPCDQAAPTPPPQAQVCKMEYFPPKDVDGAGDMRSVCSN